MSVSVSEQFSQYEREVGDETQAILSGADRGGARAGRTAYLLNNLRRNQRGSRSANGPKCTSASTTSQICSTAPRQTLGWDTPEEAITKELENAGLLKAALDYRDQCYWQCS